MTRCTALLIAATGCGAGLGPFIPDTRGAVQHARDVEPKCRSTSEEATATLLERGIVERVEAETAYVQSGADRRANLLGARMVLRPTEGVSAELLTRRLECHETRGLLGQIPTEDDDPYILPGRWLDISARSEGDGFSVAVTIDRISDAKLVLERARRRYGRDARTP